jgi:hypothetical protein
VDAALAHEGGQGAAGEHAPAAGEVHRQLLSELPEEPDVAACREQRKRAGEDDLTEGLGGLVGDDDPDAEVSPFRRSHDGERTRWARDT